VSSLDGTPQPARHAYPDERARAPDRARSSPDSNGRFVLCGGTRGLPDPPTRPLAVVPNLSCTRSAFRWKRGKRPTCPCACPGNYNQNLVESIGDGFFQLQPNGTENGERVVKVGTNVCWYNVDTEVHTVSGGPWGDSGDLQKSQAYLWPATTAGLFGYQCRYHASSEKALLRVIP
jgi:hypothetical protein